MSQQAASNLHYPIRLVDNDLLRMEWAGIYPRIDKILEILSREIHIEPALKIDYSDLKGLQGEEADDRILDLAQRGDLISAQRLVRLRYGKSMTESKKFVDELLRS